MKEYVVLNEIANEKVDNIVLRCMKNICKYYKEDLKIIIKYFIEK